jgi:hypothetical protein
MKTQFDAQQVFVKVRFPFHHCGELDPSSLTKVKLRSAKWLPGTSTIHKGPRTLLGEGCLHYGFYKRGQTWIGVFPGGRTLLCSALFNRNRYLITSYASQRNAQPNLANTLEFVGESHCQLC